MGIESFRRDASASSPAPQFEWFGDELEPTVLLRQRLMYRLDMITSVRRHLSGGLRELARPDSAMRADDDALQPFQLSHSVGHTIGMALDALGTLELILRAPTGDLRIPLFGIYPVARQALEAAATGLWMVAPESPTVRRTRALRIQVEEARDEMSLIAEFLKERPGDSPQERKYKARQRQPRRGMQTRVDRILVVALAAGLSKEDVKRGVPSMRALLDDVDSHSPMPGAATRAIWQYLSGLAHPSQLRAVQASDLELSASGEPGVSHAVMTAKEGMVLLSLDVALTLFGQLLEAVATCADNTAIRWLRDDLAAPPGWRVSH